MAAVGRSRRHIFGYVRTVNESYEGQDTDHDNERHEREREDQAETWPSVIANQRRTRI